MRRDDRWFERDDGRLRENLLTSFSSLRISDRRLSNSAAKAEGGVGPAEVGVDMAATEGAATSMTLSAISANLSMVVPSGVEASTMRTLGGNLWRNNSRRNEVSSPGRSPRSCCILRRSWVGLRSPNSSPVKSCCSLRCSERAVCLVSCSFNAE